MSFLPSDDVRSLRPDEIQLIHRVYQRVISEPWVSSEPKVREQLQRYILDMYGRGLFIEQKLLALCLAAARAKFAAPSNEAAPQKASGQ